MTKLEELLEMGYEKDGYGRILYNPNKNQITPKEKRIKQLKRQKE